MRVSESGADALTSNARSDSRRHPRAARLRASDLPARRWRRTACCSRFCANAISAATLQAVARVLQPGATFGIELVADLPSWEEYQKRVSLSGWRGGRGGAHVTLVETVRQDRERQLTIFDQQFIERRGARRRTHAFSLTFRTLSVPQMTRRLEKAGFEISALLGDYRGGPWDPRADVWMILARQTCCRISGPLFPCVFRSFRMSGHSKWHTIKHKKGAADAKRGKVFTRIIKELSVAARSGGGDVDMNPRLRTIVADAKASNMPRENIERAIRRGTGEEPGVSYEEITYEGYGPGGVALLIQTLTDNKNRTVGEIRHMLGKHAGNLAAENSVAWMFTQEGAGLRREGKDRRGEAPERRARRRRRRHERRRAAAGRSCARRRTSRSVRDAVKALGVEPASAEVAMVPQNYVKLVGKEAQQMLRLMEAIEDHDDVQHVWANFDIEEKEIEASLA